MYSTTPYITVSVEGTLLFVGEKELALTAQQFSVHPGGLAGFSGNGSKLVLNLNDGVRVRRLGLCGELTVKQVSVHNGGSFHILGSTEEGLVRTFLEQTTPAGICEVIAGQSVPWKKGDKVVISTETRANETEERYQGFLWAKTFFREIDFVDGPKIRLTKPLQFDHFGEKSPRQLRTHVSY